MQTEPSSIRNNIIHLVFLSILQVFTFITIYDNKNILIKLAIIFSTVFFPKVFLGNRFWTFINVQN